MNAPTAPASNNTATTTAPSKAAPPEFVRLTKENEKKEFYQLLPEPKWWTGGGKKDSDRGWVEIFKQSDWMCIYCSRDLAASTDFLAESTEEHLVPRSLLEVNGINPNMSHNMAPCCAGCNALKCEFVPSAAHPCWQNRKAYIKACQRFIAGRRLKNFQKYKTHVERVLTARAGL